MNIKVSMLKKIKFKMNMKRHQRFKIDLRMLKIANQCKHIRKRKANF